MIPIEKHPLPNAIEENCDFIVNKSDIKLAHKIGMPPETLEHIMDVIEKIIEFKSCCLSKTDLHKKIQAKRPDCLELMNDQQFEEIYLHWR